MRLTWDDVGSRFFKVGIDHGVLYPMLDDNYLTGVSWSGLTGVEYTIAGREKTALYTGDVKSRILLSPEEFGGNIKAYFYPDAFDPCIGNATIFDGMIIGQQESNPFGLSYRTVIGNDVLGTGYAYQLHFLYNSQIVSLSNMENTINENLAPTEFSWTFECIPIEFMDYDPVSHIAVDSRKFSEQTMIALEQAIWGTEDTEPHLLLPEEIYNIILENRPYDGFPKPGVYPALDLYPEIL